MKVILKVQDYDIVVLPIEGRVLGRLRKDGSRLGVGGKHIYIGYYFTAEEAARAYDEAAREWAGKHAILNFPNHGGDLK
jgi:hypothetical protein